MVDFADILKPTGADNHPGLRATEILIIDAADCDTVPELTASPTTDAHLTTITGDFETTAPKGFAKFYCTQEQGDMKWKQVGPLDSASFENSLNLGHPGLSVAVQAMYRKWKNKDLYVIPTTHDGTMRLYGNPSCKARIRMVEGQTGQKGGDDFASKIEIYYYDNGPAPLFTGDAPLIGES